MSTKATEPTATTEHNLPLSFRRKRRQRGQAMPLAAIGLLVMALSVVATLNLGQAVHEKIRLQNTADAAAYSLAALEARAFNFIALTNRTQIVHYNAAMALQSYLSYTGYCMGIIGSIKDIIVDLDLAVRSGCSSLPYPANVPYCALQAATAALAQAASAIFRVAIEGFDLLHDGLKMAVEAMSLFNKHAIWKMQMIRALQVNTHLMTGMQDFVQANDPAMTLSSQGNWLNMLVNMVLNSLEFQATWDRGAGMNPFWADAIANAWSDVEKFKPNPDDEKTKEAYAIMAELANASRSRKGIYDRSGYPFTSLIIANVFGRKMGQTKLVESGRPRPQIREIRRDPINYPIGDSLASDDYLSAGLGVGILGIAYVVLLRVTALGDGILADEDGGEHYRYRNPGQGTGGAPGGMGSIVSLPPITTGNVRNTFARESGDDHNWPGLSPYFKFRPNSDDNSDFNQPSTWMFLNKHHSSFQSASGSGGRPWHYKFNVQFNHGENTGITKEGKRVGGGDVTGRVSLDTTIGGERNSYLFEGLNVISRGMAYYHRPGVWREPPNMFNPFWRARLAPVGAKLMNVFDRFVGSKIQTSSDSAIVQGIVDMVRNAASDFFLRIVTAVMTH